jgi:hypothetical protein
MSAAKINLCWILSLVFMSSLPVEAAPIPLTSSSLYISAKPGLFQSPIGFSINSGSTNWVQVMSPKNNEFIEATYHSPGDENVQAALTMRHEKLSKPEELDSYSKKWMKDYPRFGFDVLAAKKVRVKNEVGFMLDLVNRENSKQLRQLIFVKNSNVVTLTCRDDAQNFLKTLKSCNEIIRTFRW